MRPQTIFSGFTFIENTETPIAATAHGNADGIAAFTTQSSRLNDSGASAVDDGPASSPAGGQPHKRGSYTFLKCSYCRERKKKCKPENRQPGQKCVLCEEKGYPCSDNRTAEAERREMDGLKSTLHLSPCKPSTIGENPLFQRCWARMLLRVESIADDIHERACAGNRAPFINQNTPEILTKISNTSIQITAQLKFLVEDLSLKENVPQRAEIFLALQARMQAQPIHYFDALRPFLRQMATTVAESRSLYDAEYSLTDIERMVDIIYVPKWERPKYGGDGTMNQAAATYLRSLESLWQRFSFISKGLISLSTLFTHDLWYPYKQNQDEFFHSLWRMDTTSTLRKDSLGRTWLHFAVENMFPSLLDSPSWLVQTTKTTLQDCHIDATDAFGRTALHIACASNQSCEPAQLAIVEKLLENNACIDIRDIYGLRAIDYAIIDHRDDILHAFDHIRGLDIKDILSAMEEADDVTKKALTASNLACRRIGEEIESVGRDR
ncbi:hypothetical protein NUW58_g2455 [Xylaria curta]|uniref:Uncharacterized protein n=1 Tax=Xylaria curta TaxID=42375 RepID=A0ACC1PFG1_9PEZI|nr:hypothetical protein NUW58_g2455 [Xylaria curta]